MRLLQVIKRKLTNVFSSPGFCYFVMFSKKAHCIHCKIWWRVPLIKLWQIHQFMTSQNSSYTRKQKQEQKTLRGFPNSINFTITMAFMSWIEDFKILFRTRSSTFISAFMGAFSLKPWTNPYFDAGLFNESIIYRGAHKSVNFTVRIFMFSQHQLEKQNVLACPKLPLFSLSHTSQEVLIWILTSEITCAYC